MVAVDPLHPSLRSDTSPKGGGKRVCRTGGVVKAKGFPMWGSCQPKAD